MFRRRSHQYWTRILKLVHSYHALFPRRTYPWVQLSGHSDGFSRGESPEWILKRSSDIEKAAFEALKGDAVEAYAPACQGTVVKDGFEFLQMRNLLFGFTNPSVMDCKIGHRCVVGCV